jgi:glutathione peroxidase
MKTIPLLFSAILLAEMSPAQKESAFYTFKFNNLDGTPFDASTLKGKKVLVVNVASKCGLTPQYTELQELYEQFGGDKFVIVAFPANNFLGQEPGTNEEIKEFCTKNYGVTFPVMEKISVKGKDIHPLYDWLTDGKKNDLKDAPVQWNFQKFMIDENGHVVGVVSPKESPKCVEIMQWLSN